MFKKEEKLGFTKKQLVILGVSVVGSSIVGFMVGVNYNFTVTSIGLAKILEKNPGLGEQLLAAAKALE